MLWNLQAKLSKWQKHTDTNVNKFNKEQIYKLLETIPSDFLWEEIYRRDKEKDTIISHFTDVNNKTGDDLK